MWLGWIIILFLKITGTKRRYLQISLLVVVNIGFASLLIILLIGHASKNLISKLLNFSKLICYSLLLSFFFFRSNHDFFTHKNESFII